MRSFPRKRIALASVLLLCTVCSTSRAEQILIEAEAFQDHGGWKLDTQFIDNMGSPYLLAHGLGTPVADATTTVDISAAGKYRVFVRTKDWVAPWKAPGAPGRFQVRFNGEPLPVGSAPKAPTGIGRTAEQSNSTKARPAVPARPDRLRRPLRRRAVRPTKRLPLPTKRKSFPAGDADCSGCRRTRSRRKVTIWSSSAAATRAWARPSRPRAWAARSR